MSRKANVPKKPMELYMVRLSPPCRVVWFYLLQNNLPHKLIDVDFLHEKGQPPEVVSRCPHKEVPVLVDGEVIVFEGCAILRYLAGRYTDNAGFGAKVEERALVDSLLSWANSDLHRAVGYHYAYPQFLERYRLSTDAATETLVESGLVALTRHLDSIEEGYLSKRRFLAADQPTVADAFVLTVLKQAEWAGFQMHMWPRVTAWSAKIEAHTHWDTVHQVHQDFLRELYKQGVNVEMD